MTAKEEAKTRKIAEKFWMNSRDYPNYPFIKERRLYEVNYLVPQIKNCNSLLDLGCGDGALIHCLMHLTHVKQYYGYDLSENLLRKVDHRVKTKRYDCYRPTKLPRTDVTIIGALFPYLFDDAVIRKVLKLVQSKTLYVRAVCTLEKKDKTIQTFSKQLGRQYSARYMTLSHTLDLIGESFTVVAVDRIYPDEIESQFGTKQFYIKAFRK